MKKDSLSRWVDFKVNEVQPSVYTFKTFGALVRQLDKTLEKIVGTMSDVQSTMNIKARTHNNHPQQR
eukprot:11367052-Heterocapsa_arctica.AAC.1